MAKALPNVEGYAFNDLPTELLLDIFKSCNDWNTLWNLARASRRLWSLLQNATLDIVEHALTHRVLIPTASLMRAVVAVRTGTNTSSSLRAAQDLSQSKSESPCISHTAPPRILLKLITLAVKIELMASLCIQDSFRKCVSIRDTMADKGSDDVKELANGARGQMFTGEPTLREPSRTEVFRAVLFFWLLQYFYELKMAHLKGRLGWSVTNLSNLQYATPASFYSDFLQAGVLTVVELARNLELENVLFGRTTNRLTVNKEPLGLPEFTATGKDIYKEGEDVGSMTSREEESGRILEETKGWRFVQSGYRRAPNSDRLQHLPQKPFHKLGLFLWDAETLANIGLWPSGRAAHLTWEEIPVYSEKWHRLLTEDEIRNAREDDW